MSAPPAVLAYAAAVAATLHEEHPGTVGVYLHGSAALGGFRAGTSDVDILAVVPGPVAVPGADPGAAVRLGERLAAVPGCPGSGLELSVITAATAADLGSCPFEVHVATTDAPARIVAGDGHPGDPDLVLHATVCREHAVAVTGPPPPAVFAPVPRERVLAAMVEELRWASLRHATVYAVLNACRAARYAEEGTLCSKLAGGEWFLRRHGPTPVVGAALTAQRHGLELPPPRGRITVLQRVQAARAFVATVQDQLRATLAQPHP
ncbi:DUF4111 domain-containing protein [Dactylosporangium aurantiacum]|uniref:DUF4111 domain-containing protein n=1 Tax=Dactylosporangium aurantiacum TaxID=35754 RepID=A0A9Q9MHQ1_9ACTN|nr:nucleotidyltransferase domain-containing protein [Dactylosporangium aurantiacum]MDG6102897.1 DUF4111 domain-containing protein [Dactylosporangium aurantiacum]UWZ52871.1 DUF4111 domain-containing protein [Dactylosporangium aurantiacum]